MNMCSVGILAIRRSILDLSVTLGPAWFFFFSVYSWNALCIFNRDNETPPFDKLSLKDEVKPLEIEDDSMTGDYAEDVNTSIFN